MTQFTPIQIPPGVVTYPTKTVRSSNWAEVNLVRWVEGELAPIGGQTTLSYAAFASRCKAIHGWYDLAGTFHIAYVCEQNVYVDTGGTLTEITPTGGWPAEPLPTSGGYGDLLYGADNYGTPRAGSSISPIDRLPNVWSVDNFGQILVVMYNVDGRLLQWDPSRTSNVNDVQSLTTVGAPSGGTFALSFHGQVTSALNWNATPSDVQTALQALGGIGSGNVACTGSALPFGTITITFQGTLAGASQPTLVWVNNTLSGGTGPQPSITHTTYGTGALLTQVGGAPLGRCFVVTQERFVMIFGQTGDGTLDGGSARRFGWCDQEAMNSWNFSDVTSQAGFLDIEPASPIDTAHAGRYGVLMFTAHKAYLVSYLGLPYIYNYKELADDCTPWSPASITSTSSLVLWMSEQGMFAFDGTAITPLACLVRPWITDDIDPLAVREQATAVHLGDFNEFWWFFPQNGQPHNTRVAIFNYKEGWWSQGRMPRSAGITSSYIKRPILADGMVVYQHETGNIFVSNTPPPWAETFDLNLTSGVRLVTVKQIMPDIKGDIGNVQFQFATRMSRAGIPELWSAPLFIRPDGYVDVRLTSRGSRMKISTINSTTINPFTIGQHLVDFAVRGDR
jgi:hypothetical protein